MVKIISSRKLTKRRQYQLQTTVHEGALAVSGGLHLSEQSLSSMTETLENALHNLNNWVLVNRGLVGHIKGFVQLSGKALMVSTTGNEVNYQIIENGETDVKENTLSLTAIVFGVDQLALEEQLIMILESLEKEEKMMLKNEAVMIDYIDDEGVVYAMSIIKYVDFGGKRFVLATERTNHHTHHHHDEGVCNCHEHHESLQDQHLYVFEWLSEVPGGKLIPVNDETLEALRSILDAR
ncbi:hypothetical protein [Acetobacterium wieringae]|uniref:hypothetical protein n=1 Tax=Acetobacterium wieringae TaxID=52694 RepID=UPI0026ED8FA3|nr:hypothetical protein [Acetobacterium wieringae]